jgi:hypothetical protein
MFSSNVDAAIVLFIVFLVKYLDYFCPSFSKRLKKPPPLPEGDIEEMHRIHKTFSAHMLSLAKEHWTVFTFMYLTRMSGIFSSRGFWTEIFYEMGWVVLVAEILSYNDYRRESKRQS